MKKRGGKNLPLTDITELMDRINTLFAAAPVEFAPIEPTPVEHIPVGSDPKAQSLLSSPMAQLAAAPRSFAQVYGLDGQSMFEQMALDAQSGGDEAMAELLRTLGEGLRRGAFDLPEVAAPAARFGRFVYPVV